MKKTANPKAKTTKAAALRMGLPPKTGATMLRKMKADKRGAAKRSKG